MASDPQGFPLTYSLTTYPTGMTINSSTGLITWPNPTPTGTQNVVVQVADPYGAYTTQGFALLVVNDLPPVFTSTPKLAADVGLLYQYTAMATNPNGAQALTYSLVSPPSGMSINANTQVALSSTTRVPNVLLVLNELQSVQSLGFEHYLRGIPLGRLFAPRCSDRSKGRFREFRAEWWNLNHIVVFGDSSSQVLGDHLPPISRLMCFPRPLMKDHSGLLLAQGPFEVPVILGDRVVGPDHQGDLELPDCFEVVRLPQIRQIMARHVEINGVVVMTVEKAPIGADCGGQVVPATEGDDLAEPLRMPQGDIHGMVSAQAASMGDHKGIGVQFAC